ncbi:chemotaxis protein CheW [Roseomonas xinghualingensis]|uniref:chemotaxis protein CheW n=1 Tax=Roseomonas xinghualingensis TaxID=2986475 RepID=UPI0021F1B7AB|nr:chemotaxis protein CheW [Roseomonas sp. SXEYE001]MCV4208785.1 chemotaxis protein CheW [Roseomonas sp. SXEYE001]
MSTPHDQPVPVAGPLVLFAMGGMSCALPRGVVRALLPLPRLDTPPGLPVPLAGFLNLGGKAVPVVELARLLGVPPGAPHLYRHLILLDRPSAGQDEALALLVDRVMDVAPGGLPIRPVEADRSLGGIIAGEVEAAGGSVHLLDPARLLMAQEAAILDELSNQARRRLEQWNASGDAA